MYVLKNALKSVARSLGRNILIGIIVLVISISCCIGLSIRQAAESSREQTLDSMSITAQISVDRQAMMQQMMNGNEGGFDRDSFKDTMGQMSGLSIDEMEVYAGASTVKSFYYTSTISLNGTDDFEAVSTTSSSSDSEETTDSSMMPGGMQMPGMPGQGGGFEIGGMGQQGDFTIIGYSSDEAMTDFVEGNSTLTDGQMFEEGTEVLDCVISEDLATYNELAVGDTITVANPNNEEETYTLNVVGIYSTSSTTSNDVMQGFSPSSDPANKIYMSYAAVKAISTASEEAAVVSTDETTGRETTTAIPTQEMGTYVFANVDDYNTFTTEVYDLGLDEMYTVSSTDLTAYEQRLLPLENLSEMAFYFLIVVLGIGAIILVVLNIFNVRERKYEIGVLTAIGMKKSKVAMQFLIEGLVVTLIALVIGAGIGAVSSVPVTNSLLSSQIEAQSSQSIQTEQSFGRPMGGGQGPNVSMPPEMPNMGGFMSEGLMNGESVDYISSVTSATDLTVLMQLLGIGVVLTLVGKLCFRLSLLCVMNH